MIVPGGTSVRPASSTLAESASAVQRASKRDRVAGTTTLPGQSSSIYGSTLPVAADIVAACATWAIVLPVDMSSDGLMM